MIWPIIADLVWTSNLSISKTLSALSTLPLDINNILVITISVFILNHLMISNSVGSSENATFSLMTMVGMFVGISFSMDSAFLYLILIEATVAPLAYLIVTTSNDNDKVESIKFIVAINTAGSIPFIVYTSWGDTVIGAEILPSAMSCQTGIIVFILLFLINTPLFLTHVWLTNAHVAASGNCSMILASIMINLGTVGILNFYKNFSKENSFYILIGVSLVGALYLSVIIFRFFDSNTLIAISSILHISILIPIMILNNSTSIVPSIMIMTAHGIISYYLFYIITTKYEILENRTSLIINSAESNEKTFNMVIVIFMFLNLGLPPFINFFSESIFLFCMSAINSFTGCLILALVIFSSVMFTIQLSTNNVYGETNSTITNLNPTLLVTNSTYFATWAALILFAM